MRWDLFGSYILNSYLGSLIFIIAILCTFGMNFALLNKIRSSKPSINFVLAMTLTVLSPASWGIFALFAVVLGLHPMAMLLISSFLSQTINSSVTLLLNEARSVGRRQILIFSVPMGILLATTVFLLLKTGAPEDPNGNTHQKTLLGIVRVNQSLSLLKIHIGQYPSQEEGLDFLFRNVSTHLRWRGPYIKKDQDFDGWGQRLRYTALDRMFELRSAGEDLEFDTPDDIVFPEKIPEKRSHIATNPIRKIGKHARVYKRPERHRSELLLLPKKPCTIELPKTFKCKGEGCRYKGGYATREIAVFEEIGTHSRQLGVIKKCQQVGSKEVFTVIMKLGLGESRGQAMHMLRSIGEGKVEYCGGTKVIEGEIVSDESTLLPKTDCWFQLYSEDYGKKSFVKCRWFDLVKPSEC